MWLWDDLLVWSSDCLIIWSSDHLNILFVYLLIWLSDGCLMLDDRWLMVIDAWWWWRFMVGDDWWFVLVGVWWFMFDDWWIVIDDCWRSSRTSLGVTYQLRVHLKHAWAWRIIIGLPSTTQYLRFNSKNLIKPYVSHWFFETINISFVLKIRQAGPAVRRRGPSRNRA